MVHLGRHFENRVTTYNSISNCSAVTHVQQEMLNMLTILGHLNSSLVFDRVHVTCISFLCLYSLIACLFFWQHICLSYLSTIFFSSPCLGIYSLHFHLVKILKTTTLGNDIKVPSLGAIVAMYI